MPGPPRSDHGWTILFVASQAPPSESSAARRSAGLVKYLGRAGHRVLVLTSTASGSGPVEGASRVSRARDATRSPMVRRRGGLVSGDGDSYEARPAFLNRFLIPDLELASWGTFAAPRALRLLREERPDIVITSSPPPSVHMIGTILAGRGVPWIADYRDGWSFDRVRARDRGPVLNSIDERLERLTVRRASAVIGVTDAITEDLRTRVNPRAVTVTNGFDPEDPDLAAPETAVETDPDRHTLVYTGTLAFGGLDPTPIVDGLRRLRRESPTVADRLEVLFAGPLTEAERDLLGARDLRGTVRILGRLPRRAALDLQRQADSLLVIADEVRPSIATGKIFEYLRWGAPILVLGSISAAARIVDSTRAGVTVRHGDEAGTARALALLVGGEVSGPDSDAVTAYAYPSLASRLAELIEETIDGGRAAASPTERNPG